MPAILYLIVPVVAFIYASVGFGGATGYLAAMGFLGMPPQVMSSTALVLNVLVAGISFTSFYRAGHLRRDLLLPFILTSIPASFLGGGFKITDQAYFLLLYAVLTLIAVRLLFSSRSHEDEIGSLRPPQLPPALAIGLGIGLLSGILGIGGGIFLSPVILLLRWGTPKHASAVAAAFIVLNSISGIAGRVIGGNFQLDGFGLSLIPVGLAGAVLGSYWGSVRFSGLALRRSLGLVMLIAVGNFWLGLWR